MYLSLNYCKVQTVAIFDTFGPSRLLLSLLTEGLYFQVAKKQGLKLAAANVQNAEN